MPRRSVDAVLDDLRRRDLLALVEEVAARRGVLVEHLCGSSRTPSASRARQEAWWCMRHHPERYYSLIDIARLFGRHHTTVMAGLEAHARRLRLGATARATPTASS
jgi:chromosomal replication initiation ATPase DnaA